MQQSEVYKELDLFATRVTKLARINLHSQKIDSTGKLKRSLGYKLKTHRNSFLLNMLAEDYWKYVNYGRKPGSFPPVNKIKQWIKQKPVRLRNSKGSYISTTEQGINQLAYLIGRKIKRKGIAPTNFLTEPFEDEFRKLPDELIEAYGLDVEELIEYTLKTL